MRNRQEDLLEKRCIELSRLAYERDIITFTDFFNLNELNILENIDKKLLYSKYQSYGGYDSAQRQMIKFIPDAVSYNEPMPFSLLKIKQKSSKFSQELGHRDFLGSILGLGIERAKVGDILIEDDVAFIFVHNKIINYIIENLIQVKNTYVSVTECDEIAINYEPKFKLIQGTVSSIRLDTVMALVYKDSRSSLVRFIENGKVFINSKLITSNGYKLKDGDFISIRGLGKLQYCGIISTTKKGKYYIEVKQYI